MSSPQLSPGVVRFGVFEANLRTGELRRNGHKVRIQELPFRALTVLLARPGEVVSREDLRLALWPEGVFVDFDQGISSAIRRLREALGDSADNPVFVETVERRGYRWIAPVHSPAAASVGIPQPASAVNSAGNEDAKEKALAALPPKSSSPWQKLVFALPILALLFAAWIFRPGYRNANAGMKSMPAVSSGGPHHTANREAEDYYLKGRFYWNKRTPESLTQAVDSFTQAIVHDPNYSDAYVGLADCYNLMREYTLMPASEAYPRALAAAKKAVELDDHSSQAHASLAFVSFFGMWDAGTADEEFRRAIDLDPNNATAHHWYATYLHSVRRFSESLNEIDRAQTLDPNSSSILADKARLLWVAGRRQESLHLLRQLAESDPNSVSAHRYLRFSYFETGDYADYLSEMKKEALLIHDPSLLAIADAAQKGFSARGEQGLLQAQIAQQEKAFAQGKLSPFYLAETYSRLGDKQKELKYLETCYDRHADETVSIAVNTLFYNLRSEPAYQQLLAKSGLPPMQ